jgi:hypothetical protein
MLDRRQSVRAKALLGGVAAFNNSGSSMECVVRNMSEGGACIEFGDVAKLPEELSLTIARKGRSFLARMVWGRGNRAGLAFPTATSLEFDQRLQRSERKKRQLQRRLRELLGEA